jgi:hypothetical protein
MPTVNEVPESVRHEHDKRSGKTFHHPPAGHQNPARWLPSQLPCAMRHVPQNNERPKNEPLHKRGKARVNTYYGRESHGVAHKLEGL